MEPLPKTHDLILYDARTYSFVDSRTEERHFNGENRRRSCRHALASLCHQGLLRRMQQPKSRINPNPAPFYLASEAGCARLATNRDDMSLLLDRLIVVHSYGDVPHSLEVAQYLMDFHEPLLRQSVVQVLKLWTEHAIINPEAPPKERRGLLTHVGTGVRGGAVVCAPDACVVVRRGRLVRIYAKEVETGSDCPRRVARKKAPGYWQLHRQGLFRNIHPEAQDFRVVVVCPTVSWRDEFRRAIQHHEGRDLWLAVHRGDVEATGGFLSNPVFWPVGRAVPVPFIPPAPSPPLEEQVGQVGGQPGVIGSAEQTKA